MNIIDVKTKICEKSFYELLAPSVYNPTEERLLNRAKKYNEKENIHIYAYEEDGKYKGIIVFEFVEKIATILDIAVKPECQGRGIGSKLIDFIFSKFETKIIIAETDDDAIDFYKKYGFSVVKSDKKFYTNRYTCICENMCCAERKNHV